MTAEVRPKAHNDHNVYILGAGFSAEAGLPLVKNFMNRMRDAAAWLAKQGNREEEVHAIERVLEFRLRAAAAAYRVPLDVENVEELFSLASAGGRDDLRRDMILAIAATLDYARTTTAEPGENERYNLGVYNIADWSRPPGWGPPSRLTEGATQNETPKREWYSCSPYQFYLGLMCGYFLKPDSDRKDTIITFNYDTIVEDNLQSLGLSFSYGAESYIGWTSKTALAAAQRAREGIRVLKLHGSINWCAAEEHWAGNGERLRDTPHGLIESMNRRVVAFPSYTALREENHQPILIAPTWQKAVGPHLAAVWEDAVGALMTATRIVILGYSMPPADQHFRFLLAAGLQENISLRRVFFVNPDLNEEAKRKLLEERLFGLFRHEHFERGTVELVPLPARQFFGAGNNQTPESYRILIGRPLNPPEFQYDPAAPWRCYSPFGAILC